MPRCARNLRREVAEQRGEDRGAAEPSEVAERSTTWEAGPGAEDEELASGVSGAFELAQISTSGALRGADQAIAGVGGELARSLAPFEQFGHELAMAAPASGVGRAAGPWFGAAPPERTERIGRRRIGPRRGCSKDRGRRRRAERGPPGLEDATPCRPACGARESGRRIAWVNADAEDPWNGAWPLGSGPCRAPGSCQARSDHRRRPASRRGRRRYRPLRLRAPEASAEAAAGLHPTASAHTSAPRLRLSPRMASTLSVWPWRSRGPSSGGTFDRCR